MNAGTMGASMHLLGSFLYLFGGADSRDVFKDIWIYDPDVLLHFGIFFNRYFFQYIYCLVSAPCMVTMDSKFWHVDPLSPPSLLSLFLQTHCCRCRNILRYGGALYCPVFFFWSIALPAFVLVLCLVVLFGFFRCCCWCLRQLVMLEDCSALCCFSLDVKSWSAFHINS